ncbi:hypothetical protein UVI_02010730 [Ustilaginoidea virens]|uniref:DNA replication factor A subunit Ssb3 n=1 Tax=Ustilaginoidea virens TaxID=1159556 RepID=A0A1B5KZB8_USTVR|nr:hypothetical protein UVI_02010730 [Ustilaginoidea virens]
MAEQLSSPRVTSAYLDSFQGRVVTIVGKVTQLRGDEATIDSDGVVTVALNRVGRLLQTPFFRGPRASRGLLYPAALANQGHARHMY